MIFSFNSNLFHNKYFKSYVVKYIKIIQKYLKLLTNYVKIVVLKLFPKLYF